MVTKTFVGRTWIVSVSLTWSQRPWFPGRGIHASLWLTIKPSKCVFETHLRLEPPRTLEQKGTSDFLCWAAVLHFCQNGVSAGCFGTKYILHVTRYSTVQLPGKSFVNMLNNVRHNMEPRGMPVVTGSRSDPTPFNSVGFYSDSYLSNPVVYSWCQSLLSFFNRVAWVHYWKSS